LTARTANFASTLTLCAIACAAYVAADIAHESLGHGGACLALGGKLIFVSTTNARCSLWAPLIDDAGPLIGILVALLALVWLRLAPPRAQTTRIFLCLVYAFAIFWNVGYMIESGLLDRGDWTTVIAGLEPAAAWHAALAIAGIFLYGTAMRVLGATIAGLPADGTARMRPFAMTLTAYLAAGALAIAAGFFDPQGRMRILTDSLPCSLGAIGLIWVGAEVNRRLPALRIAVPFSPAWIAIGLVCIIFFVAILGPGWYF
jgi:hypothetical protein